MSWFTEDPTLILALAIVLEAILAVALVRSGRVAVIGPMLVVALLGGTGLVVEYMIVTPNEQVEEALDGVARALTANSLPGVLACLAPDATELRDLAKASLPQLRFTEAKIRDLRISINRFVDPPTAKADFLGVLSVKDAHGQFPYEHYLERLSVTLRQEGNRWLLTGYARQASQSAAALGRFDENASRERRW
jgi:hypothetical protein